MLTATNLKFYKDLQMTIGMAKAFARFSVVDGVLMVLIAKKFRPVIYDQGGHRNIFLNFDQEKNKYQVSINYAKGYDSSTFFVGDEEAKVIDSILVWLIDTDNANLYA
jgi:hypothetical protein